MLIKFGSIITSGNGSLGGHTIQNSTGGVQLRTKPIPKHTPSAAQLLIRSYNPKLQAGWRALTDLQRSTWNNFSRDRVTFLKNGDPVNLSGHSLFMKYNFYYLQDNLPIITSPFLFKSVRLGPELIINGGFDSSANWFLTGDFSISGGFLKSVAVTNGTLRQNLTIPASTKFLLSFLIFKATPSAYLYFYNSSGTTLFVAPYSGYKTYIPTFYYLLVTSNILSTSFNIITISATQSFWLDNLSLKMIL